MAKTKSQKSPFAVAYANALLELANEQKQAEQINHELALLRELIEADRTFELFLADRAGNGTARGESLKRVFAGKLSPLLMNFLGVLNDKGRLGGLVDIANAYDELLALQLGKIEVDVTTASKLSAEQLEEVRKRVGAALKKDAVVHQYVDDSIIGGLVLRIGDKLIDASVKSQLSSMRQRLLETKTN